jgi:parallel beta-helix repeat protein
LRQAILDANANSGADVIRFNIAGGGVQTIAPTSIRPQITDPVTIDGTTQSGFAGSPLIELDGAAANTWYGLCITAGNSTVRGLIINRFSYYGILLTSNGNNTITGNYIGTDVTGTTAEGNAGQGVEIAGGSSNNTIGGADTNVPGTRLAGAGNLISSNGQFNTFTGGILITGIGTANNLVEGNYVSTDLTGELALGNGLNGISIDTGSAGNTIGGTASGTGNILSANGYAGISLYSSGSGNLVEGNIIGLDATGTAKLGNYFGVAIQAGSAGNTSCTTATSPRGTRPTIGARRHGHRVQSSAAQTRPFRGPGRS